MIEILEKTTAIDLRYLGGRPLRLTHRRRYFTTPYSFNVKYVRYESSLDLVRSVGILTYENNEGIKLI